MCGRGAGAGTGDPSGLKEDRLWSRSLPRGVAEPAGMARWHAGGTRWPRQWAVLALLTLSPGTGVAGPGPGRHMRLERLGLMVPE
jgi:hypothetical protein